MSIKSLSRIVAFATIAMLLAMALVIFNALQTERRVVRSEDHRLRSLALANELFQSSEDLSRMARSYVTTADPLYEQRYDAVLAIRNGQRPRPLHYSPTYWNLAGMGRGPAVEMGAAQPLRELIQRQGVAAREFDLLREALSNSDALVLFERQAFAAVKERHAHERAAAVGLLYGPRYLDAKAAIMVPIQRFADAIDARTSGELLALQRQLQTQVMMLLALVVLALSGVIGVILYTRRAVLRPLALLGRHADRVAGGDYAARCAVPFGNELSQLGRHFNHMLDAVERDIAERERAESALARANADLAGREALLQQILDTSSVAIFQVDMRGRITHANRRMAEMFGWPLAELVGKNYVDLVHPSERVVGQQKMLALLQSEIQSVDLERHYWRADDTAFLGHLTGRRSQDGAGVEGGLVGVIADVTARRMAEQRAQHHNRVLALLAEKTPLDGVLGAIAADVEAIYPSMLCCILLCDDEGRHLRLGAAASLPPALRDDLAALVQQAGAAFCAERTLVADIAGAAAGAALLTRAFQAGLGACWSQPVRGAQGNLQGVFMIFHRHARQAGAAELQLLEDEARLVALAIDQSAADARLEEHQRQLEYTAHYDALTGLPNRVLLADRLRHALAQSQRRGQSVALVYLDLDGFKGVNDRHGHQVGDALLIALARRMQAALREGDTMARIGGDEFVAVLVDLARPQDCEPVLARLLQAAAEPVHIERQALQVSASIGVTLYPRDGADADLLMRQADQAMYLAKQAGKNRYHMFDGSQAPSTAPAATVPVVIDRSQT